jgi:hypothetical protein
MTIDTTALLLFLAGMCAGATLTIQIVLLPNVVSAIRLIRFYRRTRDRRRALQLWQDDELIRRHRRTH